jgi:hypothetical protein
VVARRRTRDEPDGQGLDHEVTHPEPERGPGREKGAEPQGRHLLGGHERAQPLIIRREGSGEIAGGPVQLAGEDIGLGHRQAGAFPGEK